MRKIFGLLLQEFKKHAYWTKQHYSQRGDDYTNSELFASPVKFNNPENDTLYKSENTGI